MFGCCVTGLNMSTWDIIVFMTGLRYFMIVTYPMKHLVYHEVFSYSEYEKKTLFCISMVLFWLLEIISWFLNKKIVAHITSKLSILYGLIRSPFQGIFILKAKLRLDGVGQPHGITTACFEFSLCFALFLPLKGDPVTTSRFFIHHLKDTTRLYDKIHACLKFEWSLYDNNWSNWRRLTFGDFFRHP